MLTTWTAITKPMRGRVTPNFEVVSVGCSDLVLFIFSKLRKGSKPFLCNKLDLNF